MIWIWTTHGSYKTRTVDYDMAVEAMGSGEGVLEFEEVRSGPRGEEFVATVTIAARAITAVTKSKD